jgi:hypothetical protein
MSESGEKNNGVGLNDKINADGETNEEITLDLDFAPSWARKDPTEHIKTVRASRFDDDSRSQSRGDGYRSRGRNESWREGNRRNDRFPRGDRNKEGRRSERRPHRKDDFEGNFGGKPQSGFNPAAAGRAAAAIPGETERYDTLRQRDERGFRGAPRAGYSTLPLEIKVLPEQKALGGVIRRIQSSHKAFPLRDIAWLFLDKPASCLIRIAQQKENPVPIFQCKVCGMPTLTEDEMQSHLLNRHLDEFFDVEEVECEPPSGQFVCVMRCGLSGELLGPPNHHSFNTRVHEMLRIRYPEMSEEAYRRKIESVREPEAIEQWRQACTMKKIYRRKNPETPVADNPELNATSESPAETEPQNSEDAQIKAPPMERDVAELVFRREMINQHYSEVKHLVCIANIALQTSSRPLYFVIREMIQREKRFPTSLFFALRGAFRHRKLYLFRANDPKGPDFVMQNKPTELDSECVIDLIKEILAFIHDNPACTKVELIKKMAGSDEVRIKEILRQLAWLIDKGNIIEFYNDVLSAPVEYPPFRLLPGEKKHGKQSKNSISSTDKTEDAPDKGTAQ